MIVGVYLLIGFVFAIFFVTKGAAQIDDGAKEMSIGTKLLLFPASIAFWVVLIQSFLKRKEVASKD